MPARDPATDDRRTHTTRDGIAWPESPHATTPTRSPGGQHDRSSNPCTLAREVNRKRVMPHLGVSPLQQETKRKCR